MRRVGMSVGRFFFTAALLPSLLAMAGAAAAQQSSEIRIASTGDFAPWNETDDGGGLIGFEIDLAQQLCTRMNVDCAFTQRPWEEVFDGLAAKEYDAVMAAVSRTEERRKRFVFSAPYACGGVMFAVAKGSPLADYAGQLDRIDLAEIDADEQSAIDDLRRALDGKTVGAPADSIHTAFLAEYMPGAVDARPYEVAADINDELEAGRLDAALSALSQWAPAIDEGADLVTIGPRMSGGLLGQGVGVMIRKEDEDLAAMFSDAIDAVAADGTLQELIDKWFGYDVSC